MRLKGKFTAKCPYFETESESMIPCEGVVGQKTKSKFTERKEKDLFMKNNCEHYPNACPIARINDKKY